jgi:hypothetical protein
MKQAASLLSGGGGVMMIMMMICAVGAGFHTTDRWPPSHIYNRELNLHSPAAVMFMCEMYSRVDSTLC